MKIEIRRAKFGDEKIFAYIQTESWRSAFADIISAEDMERCTDIAKVEAMYENVLKSGYAEMSILEINDKPHCIAAWSKARNPQFSDCAELICIHSLSKNQGKGYGSIMMNHIIDEIKNSGYNSVLLWVFEKNTRARSFYEKHGFELTDNKQISYDAVEVMYRKDLCRD
ncbi:MAG: GNAT family N-acetyltransferase [Ruminococcaceae bacterium]|nr:GNAT family N-acetyltransferase [Oscillospiraceae bacterium]